MVNKEPEIFSDIQGRIDELISISKTEVITPIKKDVVLFFSFDVVNSTSYKTVNYYGWAQVLNLLFKELRHEVQNKRPLFCF